MAEEKENADTLLLCDYDSTVSVVFSPRIRLLCLPRDKRATSRSSEQIFWQDRTGESKFDIKARRHAIEIAFPRGALSRTSVKRRDLCKYSRAAPDPFRVSAFERCFRILFLRKQPLATARSAQLRCSRGIRTTADPRSETAQDASDASASMMHFAGYSGSNWRGARE